MKKCPFCGFQPDENDMDMVYPKVRISDGLVYMWRAGCSESAGGCTAEVLGDSRKDVIANWNKRTD